MKTTSIILFILLSLAACQNIRYKPDLNFLSAAQANYMEFPIKISGRTCLDMDGRPGMCSKQHPNTQDFKFSIDAQDFDYRMQLTCSRVINSDTSIDVGSGKEYVHVITKDKFQGVGTFTCIGEIFNLNNPQQVSSRFDLRIKVYDDKYTKREEIYIESKKKKKYLVMGQHALHSVVCTDKCRNYNKSTSIEIESDSFVAYSISSNMRINYKEIR